MSIEDRVRQLTGYFRDQIEAVLKLSVVGGADGQISLYRKTLLVTVLDCLAGIRFDRKNYRQTLGTGKLSRRPL